MWRGRISTLPESDDPNDAESVTELGQATRLAAKAGITEIGFEDPDLGFWLLKLTPEQERKVELERYLEITVFDDDHSRYVIEVEAP